METSLMLAMRPNEWKGLSPSRNTGFGVRSCNNTYATPDLRCRRQILGQRLAPERL